MKPASSHSEGTACGRLLRRAAPAILLVLCGAIMAHWTWMTWPDPLVDSGRELYTPWRILEGDVPYRDMALFNGPLSIYLNTLWFVIGGVSLRTLVVANLAIVAAVTALSYRLVRQVAGSAAATVSTLCFLLLLAFGQYTRIGNYCWAFAYSHELPHGIGLSLLAIGLLGRWVDTGRAHWAALCGAVLGLVFLTKAEITLAALAATAVGWLAAPLSSVGARQRWAGVLWLVITFLAIPLLALLLLRLLLPWGQAAIAVLGTWVYIGHQEHSQLPYFSYFMGTAQWQTNLLHLARWSGYYAGWLAPPALAALLWPRRRTLAVALLLLPPLVLLARWRMLGGSLADYLIHIDWMHFATPWPLLLGVVGSIAAIQWWRHRHEADLAQRPWRIMVACAFAGGMLPKMILLTRVWHYGFALSMPALLVIAAALWDGVPWLLRRWTAANPAVYRAGLSLALLLVLGAHLHAQHAVMAAKTVAVGEDGDRFWTDIRGQSLEEARVYLQQQSTAGQTLATMPEGQMLNYLARRKNPAPFGPLNPAVIVLFGEPTILSSFQANPPDYIALVHRDTSTYGPRWFGRDYGQQLWQWVQQDYQPRARFGAPPFNAKDEPGILLAQRRTTPRDDNSDR